MGAPSNSHEARVEELRTLASLAGFTVDVSLSWRLRPDVARICPATARLFVGDAKATESPRCEATWHRLRWYGIAVAGLPGVPGPTTVALAVPTGASAVRWERALMSAVGARMVCEAAKRTVLGGTTIVATRARLPCGDRSHPYRDQLWQVGTSNALSGPLIFSAARGA